MQRVPLCVLDGVGGAFPDRGGQEGTLLALPRRVALQQDAHADTACQADSLKQFILLRFRLFLFTQQKAVHLAGHQSHHGGVRGIGMLDVMAAHQQHLPQLSVEGASGICLLLPEEHLSRELRRLFHAALDLLQMRVLLPELLRDAVTLRDVHSVYPLISRALQGKGIPRKEPSLSL